MMLQIASVSRRRLLLIGAATAALGGCGSLLGPSGPPPQIYRLEPSFPPPAAGATVSWQLAVGRPYATQTLDTERIALLRGAAMDYYADAQWNDSAPRLLQDLLVEAFEKSGHIPAVAREAESLRADYALTSELRDFEAQYDTENGAPLVVVDLVVKLLTPGGRVVNSLDTKQTARAAQNSVASVVVAFDQALGAALSEIVAWTLQAPPPHASGS
ncbi:MAG TPA: ABC-type transport auxiliary lipoprotein family protein [Rhizomicrobium sp.]